RLAAEHPLHPLQPLMRQFQEAVDQPELVHHLQRGGMHGVAAKIAEEIRMLLQHHDVDAGASEQVTEHHARGPTADDTAAHLHRFTPSHRLSQAYSTIGPPPPYCVAASAIDGPATARSRPKALPRPASTRSPQPSSPRLPPGPRTR